MLKIYHTLPKCPIIPKSFLETPDTAPSSVVEELLSKLKDKWTLSVELNEKVVNSHGDDFVKHLKSESGCRMILKMFGSQTKVVTDLQETLVILADVLLWKQLVQQLLSQYKEKSGLNFE